MRFSQSKLMILILVFTILHDINRWGARKCTEPHYFICQHRMNLVGEKQRQRVYTKWNETYPNQIANEVEIYVSTNGNNNRR